MSNNVGMKVDMNNPAHGELFNAITGILGDTGDRVYFSDRLALTNQVLEFIYGWCEQHSRGETLTYKELVEGAGQ